MDVRNHLVWLIETTDAQEGSEQLCLLLPDFGGSSDTRRANAFERIAPIGCNAKGNMVSDGGRSLARDGANRLSSVTQGGATTTFIYGPSGSRVKKSNAFATTLYPDANVEIDRKPGQDTYTR